MYFSGMFLFRTHMIFFYYTPRKAKHSRRETDAADISVNFCNLSGSARPNNEHFHWYVDIGDDTNFLRNIFYVPEPCMVARELTL